MSKFSAILKPDRNGKIQLPVPPELRHGKVRIEGTLEPAENPAVLSRFGCLAGKISLAPDFDDPLDDFEEYMK
jgi:hypothetical protein